jgi:hypothetical protein
MTDQDSPRLCLYRNPTTQHVRLLITGDQKPIAVELDRATFLDFARAVARLAREVGSDQGAKN